MKNNNQSTHKEKGYSLFFWGICLILILPILVMPPYFFPPDWGKTIIFRSILAVLLFTFTSRLIYKKNVTDLPNIKKNKIIWVLLLLFMGTLLATIFSQDINFSLWGSPYRAEGAVDFLLYITFAILSFLIIKPSDWKKVLNISIFVGILVCIIAFIQLYGLFDNIFLPTQSRPPSTMGNPIMLGIYLLLLFFTTLAFAIKEKMMNRKIFYISSLFVFFSTILISGSRAAYLGLAFGIIYFLLFYPTQKTTQETASQTPENKIPPIFKQISVYKIVLAIILILGVFTVYYVNTQKSFPPLLEKNQIFQTIRSRLSIRMFLDEPRFSAWQVVFSAIKEKPVLGWGPENLAIGFDKHYDPSLPYISKAWGGWWDRAHNAVLDVAVTSGILTAIVYVALFVILFWSLSRHSGIPLEAGQKTSHDDNSLIYHGIQATLIAYFVANFFSFDGFSTYLLFFLIIGYCLHLTVSANNIVKNTGDQKKVKGAKVIMGALFVLLVFFLWQYNLVPLQINSEIVRADNLAEKNRCEQALSILNKTLTKHSFLDAYTAIHYVEIVKKCAGLNPEKNLEYTENGIELMKEAVKIRPLYSRLWIFLGSFTTVKANYEEDPTIKKQLIVEAYSYFEKALQLAPKHQETLIEWAKANMVAGDYQSMNEKSIRCVALDQSLSDCYSIKATSEIYLKNFSQAKEDLEIIMQRYSDAPSESSLYLLVEAYTKIEDYTGLINIYKKLIRTNPNVAQYHSSLAFAYYKLKDYKLAREETLTFIKLMPEAKEEAEAFLKMLPY